MRLRKSEENELRQEVRKKLNKATIEVRRIGDFLCTVALLQSGYVLTDAVEPGAIDAERMERLERKLYELEHYAKHLSTYEKILEEREESSTRKPEIKRDFSWAAEKMARGQIVARYGWEDSVLLMDREDLTGEDVIYEKTKQRGEWRISRWNPEHEDILASDWVVRA